jgi:hypothetical protein
MIVGETRTLRWTETGEGVFVFDETPTLAVTLPDGETAEPAPTITDSSPATPVIKHTLSANVAFPQGGEYRMVLTEDVGAQDPIIRIYTYFAAWTDVWGIIRQRLNRTASQLSDAVIDAELARWVRILTTNHTCLGYNSLAGNDRAAMDEALAYMVAATLRAGLGRLPTDGDLIERQEGDTRYKFADRGKSAETEESVWMRDAWTAFRRIGCIADGLPARPNMVGSLYGRGRAAEKAGYIYPATNPLLQYLSHEDRRLMGIGVY